MILSIHVQVGGSVAAIAFQLVRERLAALAPVDSQQIRLTRISEPYSMPPARFQRQPVGRVARLRATYHHWDGYRRRYYHAPTHRDVLRVRR